MSYESWRISYQSSESAAKAAYDECARLRQQLDIATTGLNKIANPAVVGCINDAAVFRKFAQQALSAIRELEK